MDETLLKIRILARAELTLAQVHARVAARRGVLAIVAVGLFVLTVAMVNVGLFFVLSARFGQAGAAFAIATINAVLGTVIIAVAARLRPGPEEQLVHEIRDMALSELSAEATELKAQITAVTDDLERIRTGIGALTGSGGLGGLGHLAPVLGLLTEALKSRKG